MVGDRAHLSRWRRRVLRLAGTVVLTVPLWLAALQQADASNKITTGATAVTLSVLGPDDAIVGYRDNGITWSAEATGATNARLPTHSADQVGFAFTYRQGGIPADKKGTCAKYDGPPLQWLVAACKGKNGDYWAVQAWQRNLPNYGVAPTVAEQSEADLRLSHWKGPLEVFTIKQDWAYRQYDHLYGSVTYQGKPLFGFGTTSYGAPTDKYGVLIYVDTMNSEYGSGWRRENSFVTHNPSGIFCYGFFPHAPHPAGKGAQYRATVVGSGVMPDMMWQAAAPGPYDPAKDAPANAEQKAHFTDNLCKAN